MILGQHALMKVVVLMSLLGINVIMNLHAHAKATVIPHPQSPSMHIHQMESGTFSL